MRSPWISSTDILVGVAKADGEYVTIPDRKEAIAYCMSIGKAGDIILLAGKGHEDYQEIKGVKHHMDERDLIEEIIARKITAVCGKKTPKEFLSGFSHFCAHYSASSRMGSGAAGSSVRCSSAASTERVLPRHRVP